MDHLKVSGYSILKIGKVLCVECEQLSVWFSRVHLSQTTNMKNRTIMTMNAMHQEITAIALANHSTISVSISSVEYMICLLLLFGTQRVLHTQ